MVERGPSSRDADIGSVAVVGVGSIGGYFGAQAALSGHDVTFCVRRPFDRLVVESGGEIFTIDGRVVTDPADVAPSRWVLLATKTYQVEAADGWLRSLCGPRTTVVVLQNGVEHVERLSPFVPAGTHIVPAIVHCGSEAVAPGHVIHHTNGHAYVPDEPTTRRLATLFTHRDGTIRPTDSFTTRAWEKLTSNVVLNPITALTGRPVGVIHDPRIEELARSLMLECIVTGRAVGAALSDDLVDETLRRMKDFPPEIATSMLQDRRSGRPLEVDAINGAVVRAGRTNGIPTPLNQAMVALLGAIDQ